MEWQRAVRSLPACKTIFEMVKCMGGIN